jgi:hypothetical protein
LILRTLLDKTLLLINREFYGLVSLGALDVFGEGLGLIFALLGIIFL